MEIFIKVSFFKRYKNRTYVFYLFPRQINKMAPDARFLCQTSSIEFLASNNFDFNKLFKEGMFICIVINYATFEQTVFCLYLYAFKDEWMKYCFTIGISYLNSLDETNLSEAMEAKRAYISNQKTSTPGQSINIPKQYRHYVDAAM